MPRSALPPGKTRYPCIEGWVGHRAELDGCEESRPSPGFDPRTVQRVVRLCQSKENLPHLPEIEPPFPGCPARTIVTIVTEL